jgi:hypothetical protein
MLLQCLTSRVTAPLCCYSASLPVGLHLYAATVPHFPFDCIFLLLECLTSRVTAPLCCYSASLSV